MAKQSKRVMDMVRREIARDPSVKSGPLYEKAKKLDRSVAGLSVRQFHAQYPLQVKRALKGGKKRRGRGRPKVAVSRRATGRKRARPAPRKAAAPRKTAAPRKSAAPQKKAAPAAAAPVRDRAAIRSVLLEFASQVAGAESKADIISVLGGLDGWVDRVVRAAE